MLKHKVNAKMDKEMNKTEVEIKQYVIQTALSLNVIHGLN